jgi:hypothetical protein
VQLRLILPLFCQVWFKNRRAKCRQQASSKQNNSSEEDVTKSNSTATTQKMKRLVKASQHSDSSGNNLSESPSSSSVATSNSFPSPTTVHSVSSNSAMGLDSYIGVPNSLESFWQSVPAASAPVLSSTAENAPRASSLSLQVKASSLSPSHRHSLENSNSPFIVTSGAPSNYGTNAYYSAAHVHPPPPSCPTPSGMDLSYFSSHHHHHQQHYNHYISNHHVGTAGMLRACSTTTADYDYNIAAAAAVDRYQQL